MRLNASCKDNVTASTDHFSGSFAASRKLVQPPKCITSAWELEGGSCAFTLSCEAVALFVVLDTAGELGPGRFWDGAFVLVPREKKRLLFAPAHGKVCEPDVAKQTLVISSLHSLLD
jgi:hypothetical protein